ncbi:hypothetical protein AGMMS49992_07520 [Clostridia bacterium]|nr:hypothetical protein AGMMS49992_07520 [Clostridia bacterium]
MPTYLPNTYTWLADQLANAAAGSAITLQDNITDWDGLSGWTSKAIQNDVTIEGNGKTIGGATTASQLNAPLLLPANGVATGEVSGVTIKDLTIKLYIPSGAYPNGFGGFMIRGTNCSFENCHVSGAVTVTGDLIGGIASRLNKSNMSHCSSAVVLNTLASTNVGGLAGYADLSEFSYCSFSGTAYGEKSLGGLVGRSLGSTYDYCWTEETAVVSTDTTPINDLAYVGGIVGNDDYDNYATEFGIGTYDHCINRASVTSNGPYVGGIVGMAYLENIIKDCQNYGTITADTTNDFMDIGGIAGVLGWDSTMENCQNYGMINGTVCSSHNGGCVGHVREGCLVRGCLNTGSVNNGGRTGGVCGGVDGMDYPTIIEACENRGAVWGDGDGIGGICGVIYGEVTVQNCIVCSSAGTIRAGAPGSGGIVGAVMFDYNLSEDHSTGTSIIQNNVANLDFIKAIDLGGQVCDIIANSGTPIGQGQDSVHRILGTFNPDGYVNVKLINNYAFPGIKLTGGNQNINGWEYVSGDTVTQLPNPGIEYDDDTVDPDTDPDYGPNSMNGKDLTCAAGAIAGDCLACLSLQPCLQPLLTSTSPSASAKLSRVRASVPRQPCVIADGVTGPILDLYNSNIDFQSLMDDLAGTLSVMSSNTASSRASLGELTEFYKSYRSTMDAMDYISASLSKELCCISKLVCCCGTPPPPPPPPPTTCGFCMQVISAFGDSIYEGQIYTLQGLGEISNITIQDTVGADGAFGFLDIPPGSYTLTMDPPPGSDAPMDPVIYDVYVDSDCQYSISVPPSIIT